jgi:hypothetical protein
MHVDDSFEIMDWLFMIKFIHHRISAHDKIGTQDVWMCNLHLSTLMKGLEGSTSKVLPFLFDCFFVALPVARFTSANDNDSWLVLVSLVSWGPLLRNFFLVLFSGGRTTVAESSSVTTASLPRRLRVLPLLFLLLLDVADDDEGTEEEDCDEVVIASEVVDVVEDEDEDEDDTLSL